MKPRHLVLVAFLLGVLAPLAPLGPVPASAASYGALTGRVVDGDGDALAGVEVNLFRTTAGATA